MATPPPARPRVVVVADRCGELTAHDAARAVAEGWAARAPHVDVEAHGLHSGGAGLPEVVLHALGGTTEPVLVPGPDGQDVPAAITWVEEKGRRTAYLDTAQVAGRHLAAPDRLVDPAGLTSAGVGRLLLLARERGAERIVVSVGDLATHDAGMGLLAELGAPPDDLGRLRQVRDDWRGVPLVLLAPDEATLLGFHGASARLGERYGVDGEVTQRLETSFGELTDRVNQALPPTRDLLTGLARRPEREPGSGAGGGVGYALQLIGARTDVAARFLLDELEVRPRLAAASLLVVVTGSFDGDTVHDGVVPEVASAALDTATPTVLLAEQVQVGRREGMSLGISGSYELRSGEGMPQLAARVARTWTPAPTPPTPPPAS